MIYEKYADDIFRYHYAHVGDRHLAEDLTADTFMRAWNKLSTFDFKQPRPWLYKIARNLLIDHWRKKKHPITDDSESEAVSTADGPVELAVKSLDKARVHDALGKLSDEMRSVVTMRFMLGYSARQTAQNLNISEENVRVIQYRALKKMKQGLL